HLPILCQICSRIQIRRYRIRPEIKCDEGYIEDCDATIIAHVRGYYLRSKLCSDAGNVDNVNATVAVHVCSNTANCNIASSSGVARKKTNRLAGDGQR